MADPFSELGLPARFDLDDSALGAARKNAGNPAAARAAAILADPRQRAEALLSKLGAPPAGDWLGTPAGFDTVLSHLKQGATPEQLREELAQRWAAVAQLFTQLNSNDKGPVQLGRQRMVRSELNAIDQLTKLGQQ